MNLEKEITEALNQKASLQTLREIVSRYKQGGGTQQGAYGTLENIRCASIEGALVHGGTRSSEKEQESHNSDHEAASN